MYFYRVHEHNTRAHKIPFTVNSLSYSMFHPCLRQSPFRRLLAATSCTEKKPNETNSRFSLSFFVCLFLSSKFRLRIASRAKCVRVCERNWTRLQPRKTIERKNEEKKHDSQLVFSEIAFFVDGFKLHLCALRSLTTPHTHRMYVRCACSECMCSSVEFEVPDGR